MSDSPDGVPMFDKLFRLMVFAMLIATSRGAFRLAVVWLGLRKCLEGFARMPIVTAFDRLPPRLARLTQLSLPGPASERRSAPWPICNGSTCRESIRPRKKNLPRSWGRNVPS